MASTDVALTPGDIVRGIVDHVDSSLDACFLDVGQYGMFFVPLEGLNGATVARMVPNARVCVQVVAPKRGKKLPRASASIEFSCRTSVLVLDGAALTGKKTPPSVEVFVSRKVPAVQRAELSSKLESAIADPATGLPSMLATAVGPITIILRTLSAEVPWEQVLSGVVVQLTEAAAFTVLARAGSEPALLMSEKADADGDASIAAKRFATPEDMLDGRRLALSSGGEVVFERTEAMWTVDVNTAHAHAIDKDELISNVDLDAAKAIGESIVEYDVSGLIAIDFVSGVDKETFSEIQRILSEALGTKGIYLTGDPKLAVVLIARSATVRS
jgi:Ribonuclease G/E